MITFRIVLLCSILLTVVRAQIYVPGGVVDAITNDTSSVGIGTANPWTKLDVSGGDITVRDVVGAHGYYLKSYSNVGSFWLIPSNGGNPRFVLGTGFSWDKQVSLDYAPEEIGAAGGLLTIGQVFKNSSTWTHGSTRFLTNGVERLRITSSGNVGIGITSPQKTLDVLGEADGFVTVGARTLGVGQFTGIHFGYREDNNYYRKAAVVFERRDEAGNGADGTIHILNDGANDNSNATLVDARVSIRSNGNVGIGTTSPAHKLAVNGTGKFKEVIVETTGWSDHVFAPDYELQSLSDVEAHIQEHRHLPGIPSEKEVAEEGIGVGEMQAKLLAKIEELTLHVISLNKRLQELESGSVAEGR